MQETINDEASPRPEEKLGGVINNVLTNFRERGVINIIYSADAVCILSDFTSNNTALNIFNYCLMFMA